MQMQFHAIIKECEAPAKPVRPANTTASSGERQRLAIGPGVPPGRAKLPVPAISRADCCTNWAGYGAAGFRAARCERSSSTLKASWTSDGGT